MKINYLTSYTNQNIYKQKSFGSADDVNLQYIYDTKKHLLPSRIETEIVSTLKKHKLNPNENLPTLMDLHLKTYKNLNTCNTLEDAENLYPEFRNILQANEVLKKSSTNINAIKEKMPLEDFSLYVLKERWYKLKTLDEIAIDLGMKNRSGLGWILNKINFPNFSSSYQIILHNSDPKYNTIRSQKTKNYNKLHPEVMLTHNRMLAQRPEIIQKNKELAEEMWARMPELKTAMSDFKREHPEISKKDFSQAFWDAHPDFKEKVSKIRKEIGYERRYGISKK